jgi:hypothetical protein
MLEVLVEASNGMILVFHSMRLRAQTQEKLDQLGGEQS